MTADDFLNGQVLLIDKPLEWTSFQAVNKIRWHIKKRFGFKKIKVGHAGTLDPLATGLLIICTGKKTKEIQTYQSQNKEYTGTFCIGATTPSFDLETTVDTNFDTKHITKELLIDATHQFLGDILQKPPLFSAIKKDGKRLYDIARKGETTEIEARKISIQNFEITSFKLPEISFKIACSKGTYIRSIANDYGKALQSGAYLSSLRRTKIGDFTVENAVSIEQFINNLQA